MHDESSENLLPFGKMSRTTTIHQDNIINELEGATNAHDCTVLQHAHMHAAKLLPHQCCTTELLVLSLI